MISIHGSIDETFRAGTFVTPASTSLVVDVSGVTRITSTGVRQWMKAVQEMSARKAYLVGCHTGLVTQMNLVSGFLGPFKVLSIYAPYYCEKCDHEFESHLDLRLAGSALGGGALPIRKCALCGEEASFDDDPDTYFGNPALVKQESVSRTIDMVIDTLLRKVWEESISQIDMHDSFLALWLAGRLSTKVRYKRFFAGLEDNVIVILGGIGSTEPGSIKHLQKSLERLEHEAAVARISPAFLADVRARQVDFTIPIISALLPFRCGVCGESAEHELTKEQLDQATQGNTTMILTQEGTAPVTCTGGGHRWEADFGVSERLAMGSLQWAKPSQEVMAYLRASTGRMRGPSRPSTARQVLAPGDEVGGFRLKQALGQGGMGEVFLATGDLERDVAVKVVSSAVMAKDEYDELFVREAKIAARVHHPNIVQIFQLGEEHDLRFMVMEFVDGWDLASVCARMQQKRTQCPERVALWTMHELMSALEALHRCLDKTGQITPIIHRDISPQNVMLARNGKVKLADFGIAAVGLAEKQARGKRGYMAPELLSGKPAGPQADIFSAGVVLYEMLAARRFHDGGEQIRTLEGAKQNLPKNLSPVTLQILEKALQHDTNKRYMAATAAKLDIVRALGTFSTEDLSQEVTAFLNELFSKVSENISAG